MYKVAERCILSEPAVSRDPSSVESLSEVATLAVVAGVLALANIPLRMWREDPVLIPERIVHLFHGCFHCEGTIYVPLLVIDLLEGCCMMGCGWSLLGVFTWAPSTSSDLAHGLLQLGGTMAPLLAALAASMLVVIILVALGFWDGSEGLQSSVQDQEHERYTRWMLLSALGVLGGLAWATCFIHAARDLARNYPDYKQLVEGIICLAFAVFVLPAWGRVLLTPRKDSADEGIAAS